MDFLGAGAGHSPDETNTQREHPGRPHLHRRQRSKMASYGSFYKVLILPVAPASQIFLPLRAFPSSLPTSII